MSRWARFIAWVDADIYESSPSGRGWASMMSVLPLFPLFLLDWILHPEGGLRVAMFVLACLVAAALFIIWLWRVIVNIRG